MQSSGPEVLELVQQAIARAAETGRAASTRIAENEKRVAEWLEQRDAIFDELAGHYLPRLDQDSIRAVGREVQRDLEAVLARRDRELTRICAELEHEGPELSQQEAKLSEVSAELDRATSSLAELTEQLVTRLKADDTFSSLTTKLVQSRARLASFRERLAEVRHEAQEKLPAYEASALFQYLWRRQYGRSRQRAALFSRRWDRWVARLIDYPRAVRSYNFLRATPELMEQAMEREEEDVDRLVDTIDEAKAAVAAEIGLTAQGELVERLRAERETLMQDVESRQQRVQPLLGQRDEIESLQGRFYDEALGRVADHFRQTEQRLLEERARQTAQREDDQMVAELRYTAEQVEAARRDIDAAHRERRNGEKHERELTYVARSLRRSGFDQQICYFDPPIDAAARLDEFFAGHLDEHQLLKGLRNDQKMQPTAGDRAREQVESVLSHPSTQSALEVVATVAGSVLRAAARGR